MRKPKIGDIVHFFHRDDWQNGKLKAYPAIVTRYIDDEKGYARLKIFDCSHAEMAQVFYSDKPMIEKWSWPEEVQEEKPKECEHDYISVYHIKCSKCSHIEFEASNQHLNQHFVPPAKKMQKAEEPIEKIDAKIKGTAMYAWDMVLIGNIEDLIKEYKGIK